MNGIFKSRFFLREGARRTRKLRENALQEYVDSMLRVKWNEGKPKDLINNGFGVLSISTWLHRQDAQKLFDEAKRLALKNGSFSKYKEAIECGNQKIQLANSGKKSPHKKFHYFDKNGEEYTFCDKKLGYGELEGVSSLVNYNSDNANKQ